MAAAFQGSPLQHLLSLWNNKENFVLAGFTELYGPDWETVSKAMLGSERLHSKENRPENFYSPYFCEKQYKNLMAFYKIEQLGHDASASELTETLRKVRLAELEGNSKPNEQFLQGIRARIEQVNKSKEELRAYIMQREKEKHEELQVKLAQWNQVEQLMREVTNQLEAPAKTKPSTTQTGAELSDSDLLKLENGMRNVDIQNVDEGNSVADENELAESSLIEHVADVENAESAASPSVQQQQPVPAIVSVSVPIEKSISESETSIKKFSSNDNIHKSIAERIKMRSRSRSFSSSVDSSPLKPQTNSATPSKMMLVEASQSAAAVLSDVTNVEPLPVTKEQDPQAVKAFQRIAVPIMEAILINPLSRNFVHLVSSNASSQTSTAVARHQVDLSSIQRRIKNRNLPADLSPIISMSEFKKEMLLMVVNVQMTSCTPDDPLVEEASNLWRDVCSMFDTNNKLVDSPVSSAQISNRHYKHRQSKSIDKPKLTPEKSDQSDEEEEEAMDKCEPIMHQSPSANETKKRGRRPKVPKPKGDQGSKVVVNIESMAVAAHRSVGRPSAKARRESAVSLGESQNSEKSPPATKENPAMDQVTITPPLTPPNRANKVLVNNSLEDYFAVPNSPVSNKRFRSQDSGEKPSTLISQFTDVSSPNDKTKGKNVKASKNKCARDKVLDYHKKKSPYTRSGTRSPTVAQREKQSKQQ